MAGGPRSVATRVAVGRQQRDGLIESIVEEASMKGRAIAVVALVLCCVLAPLAASAQIPGERIRITLAAERIVGVLGEMRPQELIVLQHAGGTGLRSIALGEVLRLERSIGAGSRWKRGLLIGGLSGLALGAVLNAQESGSDCDPSEFTCLGVNPVSDESALVVVGVLGGLIGAGIGSAFRTEQWEPIEGWDAPRPLGLAVSVRTGPKGSAAFLLGGKLRF